MTARERWRVACATAECLPGEGCIWDSSEWAAWGRESLLSAWDWHAIAASLLLDGLGVEELP